MQQHKEDAVLKVIFGKTLQDTVCKEPGGVYPSDTVQGDGFIKNPKSFLNSI